METDSRRRQQAGEGPPHRPAAPARHRQRPRPRGRSLQLGSPRRRRRRAALPRHPARAVPRVGSRGHRPRPPRRRPQRLLAPAARRQPRHLQAPRRRPRRRPAAPGRGRLRLARAAPRRDPQRPPGRQPRLLRDLHHPRPRASGAGRPRRPRLRHHRRRQVRRQRRRQGRDRQDPLHVRGRQSLRLLRLRPSPHRRAARAAPPHRGPDPVHAAPASHPARHPLDALRPPQSRGHPRPDRRRLPRLLSATARWCASAPPAICRRFSMSSAPTSAISASSSHANGRRLVLVSCLDNLLKGAAGQAVQNMNVMYGWNEAEGLL